MLCSILLQHAYFIGLQQGKKTGRFLGLVTFPPFSPSLFSRASNQLGSLSLPPRPAQVKTKRKAGGSTDAWMGGKK